MPQVLDSHFQQFEAMGDEDEVVPATQVSAHEEEAPKTPAAEDAAEVEVDEVPQPSPKPKAKAKGKAKAKAKSGGEAF